MAKTICIEDAFPKGMAYTIKYFDNVSPDNPLESANLMAIPLDNHKVLFMCKRKEDKDLPERPFGVVHNSGQAYKKMQDKAIQVVGEMAKTYKTKTIEDRTTEKILTKK